MSRAALAGLKETGAALTLLVGAEFTQVYARRHGGGVTPRPGAVRVESSLIADKDEP